MPELIGPHFFTAQELDYPPLKHDSRYSNEAQLEVSVPNEDSSREYVLRQGTIDGYHGVYSYTSVELRSILTPLYRNTSNTSTLMQLSEFIYEDRVEYSLHVDVESSEYSDMMHGITFNADGKQGSAGHVGGTNLVQDARLAGHLYQGELPREIDFDLTAREFIERAKNRDFSDPTLIPQTKK